MNVYKFSDTATEVPTLNLETPEQVKEFLFKKYNNPCQLGIEHLLRNGSYKLMGWKYVFLRELNRYLVKQHGTWSEYYAPNKTLLRKQIYGRVDEIILTPIKK